MRPRVRGDINPTVVVSSRLSGMLKSLLLFKMSSIRACSSLPRACIEEKGSENRAQISVHIQHPHSPLDSVPAVFHWRRHTHPRSSVCFVQQCWPATGRLGGGIPWRDGTGCCHVTAAQRQSHHMSELLPALYLCYGAPCKHHAPSNPLINYHVLTLI